MLEEKVKELQTLEGLSDYRFAEKIGVSHQLWQMTRTGKREIGLVILKAITRAYPELDRDVLLFLRGDVNITSQLAVETTDAPQTHQDKNLGILWGKAMETLKSLFSRIKN